MRLRRCISTNGFNTSHVTLYRNPVSAWSVAAGVSIHLMLLFISKSDVKEVNLNRFQYISCYSLSKKKRDLRCIWRCFNTSHVTLYQLSISNSTRTVECFNTSHVTLYRCSTCDHVTTVTFQYISCYSLSVVR